MTLSPGPSASGLVPCPACARPLSPAAAACPQCGHPMRAAEILPHCCACEAPATTRCQGCGTFSCAQHLQRIYVWHGKGGANELRCATCFASAEASKRWGVVLGLIGVAVVLIVMLWIFTSAKRRKAEAPDLPWPTYPLPPK